MKFRQIVSYVVIFEVLLYFFVFFDNWLANYFSFGKSYYHFRPPLGYVLFYSIGMFIFASWLLLKVVFFDERKN